MLSLDGVKLRPQVLSLAEQGLSADP